MTDTLRWDMIGETFQDGSRFSDWVLVEDPGIWHWQYDTHEISFAIYAYDGQFWKLYRSRYAKENGQYNYGFGGQACRMALVSYLRPSRSPHSQMAMHPGDLEWVRTYEVDQSIHSVIKAGEANEKYGPPFGSKRAA